MRFVAASGEFLEALQDIQGIAGQRSINPMLSETLLETTDSGITLYATDLSISVQETVKANVKDQGAIVVHAKKLYEIARQLPEAEVEVQTVASGAPSAMMGTVDGSWLHLASGHSQFKIVGLPAEEFPPMPEYDESCLVEINFSLLKLMLSKIIDSMCENDARKYLNGGLIEFTGEETTFVSTDSHRLSWAIRDIGYRPKSKDEGGKASSSEEGKTEDMDMIVVPRNSILEIMRLFKEDEAVRMGVDRRRLVLKSDRLLFISSLIDTEYPDYRTVIPKSYSFRAKVSKDDLVTVIRRVSVCADPKTRRVRFFFKKGRLTLVGEDAEIGEAVDSIEAEYVGDGLEELIGKQKEESGAAGEAASPEEWAKDSLEIDYNYGYILDAVGAIETDNVLFEISEPTAGCVVKPDQEEVEQLCIIMPMGR